MQGKVYAVGNELSRALDKLIAYGINLALHKGLTIEDIDMLVE